MNLACFSGTKFRGYYEGVIRRKNELVVILSSEQRAARRLSKEELSRAVRNANSAGLSAKICPCYESA